MKYLNIYPIFCIIPLFIIAWGIVNILFFDTFYSRSVDPEYPYLINGLNVAMLEFKRIGHFDHPGTPFQVFCGLIIRITHLFTGTEHDIATDVFKRPDYYLNSINLALILLHSFLVFLIGWVGKKRNLSTRALLIIQSAVLFNSLLIMLFSRVIPERWILITSILFIIVYLQYGHNNLKPLKFAIWSGVVMGMGMATKFNFLPLIFLPLLLIDTNKNRLIYAGSGIVSFFVFISPIITKFKDYWQFITSIAKHDGIYGQGEQRMFNPETTKANLLEVFHVAPELIFIISLFVVVLILSIIYRTKNKTNRNILFCVGMFLIIFLQIIMVSKHFKNAYLVPLFSAYGIIFFWMDDFFITFFNKKWTKAVFPAIVFLLVLCTAKEVVADMPMQKAHKENREELRQYVTNNLTDNALWFVEPTWESAPYVENGIIYGLSYCHRTAQYFPELMKINPNVITFEGMDNAVKIWRSIAIPLDSIVTTATPIYIYSTSGRHADMLMEKVNQTAQNMGINMITDTLFSQEKTQSHIISMYNPNSCRNAEIWEIYQTTREIRIEDNIKAIYDNPQWLEKTKEKAKKKNIPIDSMVRIDAIWMVDNP